MFFHLVISIIGLVVLIYSADKLVEAASNLALNFGVSKMVIGLTIVAAGTSLPEFVVSINSSIKGDPSLSLGNVIGSNIMNIALILGITAVILPINSSKEMVKREVPIMIAVTALVWVFAKTDSVITPFEGFILLAIFVSYNVMSYIIGKREANLCGEYEEEADRVLPENDEKKNENIKNEAENKEEVKEDIEKKQEETKDNKENNENNELTNSNEIKQMPSIKANICWIIAGLIGMVIGSEFLVRSATKIAMILGISNEIIGLTLVAIGTSLPELATSVVAAKKGQADLSVGNVLGSNIFNITAIVGTAAVIPFFYKASDSSHFLLVSKDMLALHIPIMMVMAVILLPIMLTDMKISRNEGAFFLAIYLCYTIMLVQSTQETEKKEPNTAVQEVVDKTNINASQTIPLVIPK